MLAVSVGHAEQQVLGGQLWSGPWLPVTVMPCGRDGGPRQLLGAETGFS